MDPCFYEDLLKREMGQFGDIANKRNLRDKTKNSNFFA